MTIRELTINEIDEVHGGGWRMTAAKEIAKSIAISEAWEATKAGVKSASDYIADKVPTVNDVINWHFYQHYSHNNNEE